MGLRCPNVQCKRSGSDKAGSIIRYGFYTTKWGKRRRYRCQTCGKTFCSNFSTPYHRLQHRRTTFDEVAALSVEGLNKSAIARVMQIAWNTVHRWLEKAAAFCRRFNNRKLAGIAITELQADEIRTIIHDKEHPFGSLLRSKSCHGFGHQQLLEDAVIGTHSPSLEISPAELNWNIAR
jgi:transposase-like protein